ncbi:MAG: Asp-tRNA(Asn)/Glu-tRNA(Gln) amidotransferase subunit GatB [Anaerolineaceae bacterium]|nr:Asp-tRNA(Asn)/Glu-tRNA(Gln) amidotransferase subunit GatB [Anaerolineaceae bacterium]
MSEFEVVIGLETHIQLNTKTKIFCSCKADSWFDPPNSNICPVCTGLPGVLPVLNKIVVEKAVLLAKAMHAEIPWISFFDRKNYFYPDLPKGYQITQYDISVGKGGYLDIPMPNGDIRRVTIDKLHLEEDAGKTRIENNMRHVDFNRCGVPLIEMVTQPDLRSADEASQYLIRLRQLLRWLGISEADMEKGHLRCDANVSIRPQGADYLNPKTEIKNVNSIDAVNSAIKSEVKRQIKEVKKGNQIKPWTLDWDDDSKELRKMRSKETEADYRYFREPDLLPVRLTEEWKESILAKMPELPLARRQRFIDEYNLPEYDADIMTIERSLSEYFEKAAKLYKKDNKKVSNWLMNDVMRILNDKNIIAGELKLLPEHLAEIMNLIDAGTVNNSTGKSLLEKVENSGMPPAKIVKEEGLAQVQDDSAIREICQTIISDNPDEVQAYQKGKDSLIGWFVGQVMRQMRGKANPQMAKTILEELLKE